MTTELERLQTLMQTEEMSAKDFSAEVGIAASTMSNILNGRNKPSLEVLQKVLQRFRLVSPEWLILGVGTMYKSKQAGREQTLFDVKPEEQPAADNTENTENEGYKASAPAAGRKIVRQEQLIPVSVAEKSPARKISKVIVFYDDGSFDEITKTS